MPVNDKKRAYGQKLVSYIEDYKSAFVVTCDNVGSTQMQQIRVALRGHAVVLMGKNTTMRKVIKDFLKKNEGHPIENLLPNVVGNMGLIFTNSDVSRRGAARAPTLSWRGDGAVTARPRRRSAC